MTRIPSGFSPYLAEEFGFYGRLLKGYNRGSVTPAELAHQFSARYYQEDSDVFGVLEELLSDTTAMFKYFSARDNYGVSPAYVATVFRFLERYYDQVFAGGTFTEENPTILFPQCFVEAEGETLETVNETYDPQPCFRLRQEADGLAVVAVDVPLSAVSRFFYREKRLSIDGQAVSVYAETKTAYLVACEPTSPSPYWEAQLAAGERLIQLQYWLMVLPKGAEVTPAVIDEDILLGHLKSDYRPATYKAAHPHTLAVPE